MKPVVFIVVHVAGSKRACGMKELQARLLAPRTGKLETKLIMKLNVRYFGVPSAHAVRNVVEDRVIKLKNHIKIDATNVRLEHRTELSPPYRVEVHLVTPGPDLVAGASDHTLHAAVRKALEILERALKHRDLRRKQRLKTLVWKQPWRRGGINE